MSRKKKRLVRASIPLGMPGGTPGMHSVYNQTFYGSKAGVPVYNQTAFSPGQPLAPQPQVNPAGLPIQYKFPIAANTFPIDRTQGNTDIPSFQQLRNLARLYSGISLCERVWFDLVPRMQLKISLRKDLIAQGVEEQQYQKQISAILKFFDKPDGRRDLHTWLRMALREQTQIDELYIYKHKTRGGKLLSLHVVAGDTMKPLLNDWGDIPLPTDSTVYAYQQYPWGIPGMQYRVDQMIHYQESPAADSPYGQSRVERIILEVNQALRKKRKDTSHFTEGNIPNAFMEVPEASSWTPDQIDAYEQSWNALLAGSAQQQVRMKFLQPGMKYIPAEQYELLSEFDKFLLTIAAASYGLSLQDIAFTEQIHKSSGDAQQNVLYRRTIGPLAIVYGMILTDIIQHDLPPELQGELFEASFGGFEEAEALNAIATAYSTLTNAGILGVTNAAKLMKLPEDPNAPHIGRIIITKDGPMFLDDMASDAMRKAAAQAKLAGLQLAANPPAQQGEAGHEAPEHPTSADRQTGDPQQKQTAQDRQEADESDATPGHTRQITTGAHPAATSTSADHPRMKDVTAEYRRWRQRALEDVKASRKQRGFTSVLIPEQVHHYISHCLRACHTPDEVRTVFARAQAREPSLTDDATRPDLQYNEKLDVWEPADTDLQLEVMRQQGIQYLRWKTGALYMPDQEVGVCPMCAQNDGVVVRLGQQFPSGHRLPPCHLYCECHVESLTERPAR